MQYCTQCGVPLGTDTSAGHLCEACREKAAGLQAPVSDSPAAIDLKDWRSYATFVQSLLRHPERSMREAAAHQGYKPGLVAAGIAALVLSLILLVYIRQIYGLVGALVGGAGLFLSSGFGFSIPYGSLFFRFLIYFLLQWALLSALLLAGAKVVKAAMAPHQAFNLAGMAKLYFAAGAIAGMIAGLVDIRLGVALFGGALALSTVMLYQGLKPVVHSGLSYYVGALISIYYLAQFFLIRIFV